MTLSQLRGFLQSRGGASLLDVAKFFDVDAESMESVLTHWMRKGRVRCQGCTRACFGCRGCPMSALNALYFWV